MYVILITSMLTSLDVVWTWTNSSDSSDNRVREWNELYHSIRLFKKYSVNYNRLIVVTPHNVQPSFKNIFGVEYVDRNKFADNFPNSQNSYVLEFQLHKLIKLKKLTKTIMYLNDDWFITQKFDVVQHCNAGYCQENWGRFGYHYNGHDTFVGAMTTTNRALKRQFKNFKPTNQMAHVPFCVRIDTMKYIWKHFDVIGSMSDRRANHNFQFQYLHALTDRYAFGRSFRRCDYHFVMNNGPISNIENNFERVLRTTKLFLCINDDIENKYLKYRELILTMYNKFLYKL